MIILVFNVPEINPISVQIVIQTMKELYQIINVYVTKGLRIMEIKYAPNVIILALHVMVL